MRYVEEFLSLRCAPDILAVAKIKKDVEKEITEAMSLRKYVKNIVLNKPDQFTHIDLCSGNALLPLLTTYTLPVKEAVAIDIRRQSRDFSKVRNFTYVQGDLYSEAIKNLIRNKEKVILTAVHPCKHASQVIEYYDFPNVVAVIVIPCCTGDIRLPKVISDKS